MPTIPFRVLLLLLPAHRAMAQQARGQYLAVHGPDAPILNHVFAAEGRKTVTLRVADGFGRPNSVSEWSRTLYIYAK